MPNFTKLFGTVAVIGCLGTAVFAEDATPAARTDLTPEVRERTQALHDALMAIKGRVYTLITYLGIAATANLAAQQDNAATAPSTPTEQ